MKPEGVFPGAAFRVAIICAIILAVAYVLMGGRAHADEKFHCGKLTDAKEMVKAAGGGDLTILTKDQWEFARGLFVGAPNTPDALPPGDSASISMFKDGTAQVLFTAGDKVCGQIEVGKVIVDVLMKVGGGVVEPAEDGEPL